MNQRDEITNTLLKYIYDFYPQAELQRPLPMDKSLIEIGVLDSFGIIEIVGFIESTWHIRIENSELTMERFGGINKMVNVITEKLHRVPNAKSG